MDGEKNESVESDDDYRRYDDTIFYDAVLVYR